MSSDNPFGEATANPFADPSVQNATNKVQMAQSSLDDYNPFAEKNYQSRPAAIINTDNKNTSNTSNTSQSSSNNSGNYQPPPPPPPPLAPPQFNQTSAQKLNLSEIERQQEELNRRAAELDRREQMLANPSATDKNFPPLPRWFPLKPCFYQDIAREIPVEFQKWVRVLFYLWLFHTFTMAFNIVAALVVFIALGNGVTFGFSIFYFILFTPLSYMCWFRPAYKGFRNDSSVDFMVFFFVFFLQCIVSIIMCFGEHWFCGIILLISVMSTQSVNNVVSGIFVLLTTLCFIGVAAADILMLIKVHRLYRSTGASFEKAQAEFATGVMSNKNVQNAAATVVTESARAAMSQQSYGSSAGKF